MNKTNSLNGVTSLSVEQYSPRCDGCGIIMPHLEHEEICESRESNDGALLCMTCEVQNQ